MASEGDGSVGDAHSCLTFLLCSQEELPMQGLTSDLKKYGQKNAMSATARILKVQLVSKRNWLMRHSKTFTLKCTYFLAYPVHGTEMTSIQNCTLYCRDFYSVICSLPAKQGRKFVVLGGKGNIGIFSCGSN